MIVATCRTETCAQVGVAVPVDLELADDEQVFCGTCMAPCELVEEP